MNDAGTAGQLQDRAQEVREYFRRPGTVRLWWDPENDPAKHFLRRSERVFREALDDLPREAPVLDACTGRGRFAMIMAEMGFANVSGVDISEDMLSVAAARAADRGLRIRFAADEAETLATIADRSMAAVSIMEAFDHIPDTRAALRAVHRALRPGGRLIGTITNARSFYGASFAVYRSLIGRRSMIAQVISPRDLAGHLEATGFELERTVGIQLVNFPHTRIPLLRWLLTPFRLLGRLEGAFAEDYRGPLSTWCTSVVFVARRK
jgi:2-polyprenyl-6-hydroxyphenyl methylase/3-demethylubiquinone-9 3-methyltransferase